MNGTVHGRTRFVVLAALICACGSPDKQPAGSADLLASIPVMPASLPSSSSAGSEAVESGYSTPLSSDSVAQWYRRWLVNHAWHIAGDLPSPGGGVTLSAEKERRSIWLVVRPSAGGGAHYSVIAADAANSPAAPRPSR